MTRFTPSRFALLLLLTCSAAAGAQSGGDLSAFEALRASSIGALTPLMTPAMTNRRFDGAQLGIRYGLRNESGVRTQAVAVAALFAAGLQGSVTLTAGVTDRDCAACGPSMMLGAGADMRVWDGGDVIGGGSALSAAVSGDLAYAQLRPGDASAFALGVGVPVTLAFGTTVQGMRFAPYFVPTFGVGSMSGCPSGVSCGSGVRWVLGGGVGVWNPMSTISASLGINQVMLSGARPVFGLNVLIGGGR